MARTKTAEHWRERVRTIYRNAKSPKPGRKRVADQLVLDYPDDKDHPGERVVGKFIADFKLEPESVQREYDFFAWPQSMQAGILPWEASRALLDLLQDFRGRPILIPLARWFWRASQAMPGASVPVRLRVALTLHVPRGEAEALQMYLAYAPWRSDDPERQYEKAIEAGWVQRWDPVVSGVPVGGLPLQKLTGDAAKAFREAMEEIDD